MKPDDLEVGEPMRYVIYTLVASLSRAAEGFIPTWSTPGKTVKVFGSHEACPVF